MIFSFLHFQAFPLHFGIALHEDESAEAHKRRIKKSNDLLQQLSKQLSRRLAAPSEQIKEQCVACKVALVTVFDLRLHLESPHHKDATNNKISADSYY